MTRVDNTETGAVINVVEKESVEMSFSFTLMNCTWIPGLCPASENTLAGHSSTSDGTGSFILARTEEETTTEWKMPFLIVDCTLILDLSPTPGSTVKGSHSFTTDGVASFILVKTMEEAATKWNFSFSL